MKPAEQLDAYFVDELGEPLEGVPVTHLHAVPYLLLDEKGKGSTETWTPDNVNLTYLALVRRADRYLFLVDMMGFHRMVAGEIARDNPQPHHEFPWMVCIACDLVDTRGVAAPWNEDGRGIEWDGYCYRLVFAAPPYAVTPIDGEAVDPGDGTTVYLTDAAVRALPGGEKTRFVERPRSRFEFSQLPMPGHYFQWKNGEPVPEDDRGKQIGMGLFIPAQVEMFSLVWRYVPTIPRATINAFANSVNSAEWEGFEAECLLFAGAEIEPINSNPSADRLYNITYNFIYRAPSGRGITWNRFPFSTEADFMPITDRNNNPPFRLMDFDGLFSVTPPA